MASFCSQKSALCDKVSAFIQTNQEFMEDSIDKYSESDPFWYQVQLFLAQLEGLVDGYNSALLEPLNVQQLLLVIFRISSFYGDRQFCQESNIENRGTYNSIYHASDSHIM